MPLEQTVTLATSNLFGEAVGAELLSGIVLYETQRLECQPFHQIMERWQTPAGMSPRIYLSPCGGWRREQRESTWSLSWQDCPIAVWVKGIRSPIIALNIPLSFPGDRNPGINGENCLIVRREELPKLVPLLERLNLPPAGRRKNLRSNRDTLTLADAHDWDHLVLDSRITRLVQRDFELFFARQAWFRAHRLPFRRGYLFYGPPGNGKSSVIKVMAAHRLIEPFLLNFDSGDLDDSGVYRMFELAHRSAPSLIILEDLDRVFPRGKANTQGVNFQALLNCLDGVATQEGVIVVATANDPTALDAAILQRPGRFDRVVAFRPPSAELRRRYWLNLNPNLAGEVLDQVIAAAEGFSFAQLRETYVLAGQDAFEAGREIVADDLWEAIQLQRADAHQAKQGRPSAAGFLHSPDLRPTTPEGGQ